MSLNKILEELKGIIQNQKTVRTTRLDAFVSEVNKALLVTNKKQKQQDRKLDQANTQIQLQKTEIKKLKSKLENYMDVRVKYKALKEEHALLIAAQAKLKRKYGE